MILIILKIFELIRVFLAEQRKMSVYEEKGSSASLLRELAAEDPMSYRNFLRTTEDNFNELLLMV